MNRVNAAWAMLIVAGVLEIGWPLGLKVSQAAERRIPGLVIAAVCMVASGALLWLAQRDIPIGTAYAVWTGIGAAGTFLIGILFFGDTASVVRITSACLIIAGVVGLKLAHAWGRACGEHLWADGARRRVLQRIFRSHGSLPLPLRAALSGPRHGA